MNHIIATKHTHARALANDDDVDVYRTNQTQTGFTKLDAEIQIKHIVHTYGQTAHYKFHLVYDNHTIDAILRLSPTDNFWSEHRKICLHQSHENMYILQNKIETVRLLKSNQFAKYVANYQQHVRSTPSTDLRTMNDFRSTQRIYELSLYEYKNTKQRARKHEYFMHTVSEILADNDYYFVLKPSHLSWSIGVELYDAHKWTTDKMTMSKLWRKMETLITRNDVNATGTVRDSFGRILNAGVLIEGRFKFCNASNVIYCGNYQQAVVVGRPREVKVQTVFGRVAFGSPVYSEYFKLFRNDGYQCSFAEQQFAFFRDISVHEFCANLYKSIEPHWQEIVFWMELLANYFGLDRLRVDWFYDEDGYAFNEIAYPGKLRYAGDQVEQYLTHILFTIYHQYLHQIVADHYTHRHLPMNNNYAVLNDGNKIPLIGLGTNYRRTFGDKNIEYDALKQIIRTSIDAGYRLFDTAEVYGNEAMFGRIFKELRIDRKDIYLTSKIALFNKQHMEESLRDLQTEYIDLYLIHSPHSHTSENDGVDVLQVYDALLELKRMGKIKSVGVSNFGIRHLRKFIDVFNVRELPTVNQIELNPFCQEMELIEFCQRYNIFLQAFCPLARNTENVLTENEVIAEIARKYKKSSAQVMIRWSVQNGYGAIPKSSKLHRIEANIDVFDLLLDEQDMQRLNALNQRKHIAWTADKDHPVNLIHDGWT